MSRRSIARLSMRLKKTVDTGVVQTTQIYNLMGVCAMKTEDYEAALEYIQAGLAMAETDMSGEEEKNSENGKILLK